MITEWARVNQRTYTMQVTDPKRFGGLHLMAYIQAKDKWSLYIGHEFIANFQTFEELNGMVPILVNAHLRRNE